MVNQKGVDFFMAQKVKSQKQAGRTRNFATVVYPESAPDHWIEILSEKHIPAFISPLHEKDINPDKTTKKAHYHVLLMFDGPKDFERQIKPIFDEIGGVGRELVASLRGYARYLCHLDNPEKYQYDPSEVTQLGGADYFSAIGLPTDRYRAIGEMMDWIDTQGCVSYASLTRYARTERPDWFRILCDNGTVVVREYIKSVFWEKQESQKLQK